MLVNIRIKLLDRSVNNVDLIMIKLTWQYLIEHLAALHIQVS